MKKSILTTKSWLVVVWQHCLGQNETLWNITYWRREILLLAGSVGKKKCSQSKTFWVDTTTRTLSQHWRLCQKWSFYHNKGMDKLKLWCNSANLVKNGLHRSTSKSFYLFTESHIFCFQKFGKIWLEDLQMCSHVKLLLPRLKSAYKQVFANRLMELMMANFNVTQSVKLCPQESTEGTIWMQICKDSSHVRTNLEVPENAHVVLSTNEIGL